MRDTNIRSTSAVALLAMTLTFPAAAQDSAQVDSVSGVSSQSTPNPSLVVPSKEPPADTLVFPPKPDEGTISTDKQNTKTAASDPNQNEKEGEAAESASPPQSNSPLLSVGRYIVLILAAVVIARELLRNYARTGWGRDVREIVVKDFASEIGSAVKSTGSDAIHQRLYTALRIVGWHCARASEQLERVNGMTEASPGERRVKSSDKSQKPARPLQNLALILKKTATTLRSAGFTPLDPSSAIAKENSGVIQEQPSSSSGAPTGLSKAALQELVSKEVDAAKKRWEGERAQEHQKISAREKQCLGNEQRIESRAKEVKEIEKASLERIAEAIEREQESEQKLAQARIAEDRATNLLQQNSEIEARQLEVLIRLEALADHTGHRLLQEALVDPESALQIFAAASEKHSRDQTRS